jgi:hypothetical protein
MVTQVVTGDRAQDAHDACGDEPAFEPIGWAHLRRIRATESEAELLIRGARERRRRSQWRERGGANGRLRNGGRRENR